MKNQKQSPSTKINVPIFVFSTLTALIAITSAFVKKHEIENFVSGRRDYRLGLAMVKGNSGYDVSNAQTTQLEREMRVEVDTINTFVNLDNENLDRLASDTLPNITKAGANPMITFELLTGKDNQNILQRFNSGQFDNYVWRLTGILENYFKDPTNKDKSVIIRFGHEVNGDWYPWSGNPEEFTKAFSKFALMIRSKDVLNSSSVKIDLNLNAKSFGKYGFEDYLTPDNLRLADEISVDGYIDDASQTPDSLFGELFKYLKANNITKPVRIAEFGVNKAFGDEIQSKKISELLECFAKHKVIGASLFNHKDEKRGIDYSLLQTTEKGNITGMNRLALDSIRSNQNVIR